MSSLLMLVAAVILHMHCWVDLSLSCTLDRCAYIDMHTAGTDLGVFIA